ncbi:MAG: hypothetical protein MZV65_37690 [Chromatiales bacterium]|nr:hypothetical protein [Chromatiales bacterium]
MTIPLRRLLRPVLLSIALALSGLQPAAATDVAAALVRLLGDIGVDYPETVIDGRARMPPSTPGRASAPAECGYCCSGCRRCRCAPSCCGRPTVSRARSPQLVPGSQVAALTEQMRSTVFTAYGITAAPRKLPISPPGRNGTPGVSGGCHAGDGRGDSPQARNLDPAPFDFHDVAPQSRRRVRALQRGHARARWHRHAGVRHHAKRRRAQGARLPSRQPARDR